MQTAPIIPMLLVPSSQQPHKYLIIYLTDWYAIALPKILGGESIEESIEILHPSFSLGRALIEQSQD